MYRLSVLFKFHLEVRTCIKRKLTAKEKLQVP